jgi:hypothetical protein
MAIPGPAQEVAIAVVTCEEACWVRLLDKGTGELFAECPVPKDQPLVTVRVAGRPSSPATPRGSSVQRDSEASIAQAQQRRQCNHARL